jgi:hypothetical protein
MAFGEDYFARDHDLEHGVAANVCNWTTIALDVTGNTKGDAAGRAAAAQQDSVAGPNGNQVKTAERGRDIMHPLRKDP